jgi:hypothetical protein
VAGAAKRPRREKLHARRLVARLLVKLKRKATFFPTVGSALTARRVAVPGLPRDRHHRSAQARHSPRCADLCADSAAVVPALLS